MDNVIINEFQARRMLKADQNYFESLITDNLLPIIETTETGERRFNSIDVNMIIPTHGSFRNRKTTGYSLKFNHNYFDVIDTPNKAYLAAYFKFYAKPLGNDVITIQIPKSKEHILHYIYSELEVEDQKPYPVIIRDKYHYIKQQFHSRVFFNSICKIDISLLDQELSGHALRALIERDFKLKKISGTHQLVKHTTNVSFAATMMKLIWEKSNINALNVRHDKKGIHLRLKFDKCEYDPITNEFINDPTELLNFLYPTPVDYIHDPEFAETLQSREDPFSEVNQ